MSSVKSSAERSFKTAWKYTLFNLKFNWQKYALCLIIFFIAAAISSSALYSEMVNRDFSSETVNVTRMLRSSGTVNIVISICMAFFFGMTSMSYVNSKTQIGCYHSFPVSRMGFFLSDTLTHIAVYALSSFVGTMYSYLFYSIRLPDAQGLVTFEYAIQLFLFSAALFMVIYALYLLAGSVTGTVMMKFIMSLVIMFLPLCMYLLGMLTFSIADYNINSDYYMETEILSKLCIPVKIVEQLEIFQDTFLLDRIFEFVPAILVFYISALALYSVRRSEDTGKTIIWKPVFAVVKYAIIFTAALLGIIIFSVLFSERQELNMIVGALIGLFLSFIIVNSIFYRSTREMFKGIVPIGIFTAAVLVFTLVVPANITGMIGEFYSVRSTDEVSVEFHIGGSRNMVLEFDDEEEIEKILNLYKNSYRDGMGVEVTEGYFLPVMSSLTQIEIVQKPNFGIPLAKLTNCSYTSELWDYLLSNDEFVTGFNELNQVDVSAVHSIEANLGNEHYSINIMKDSYEWAEAYDSGMNVYYIEEAEKEHMPYYAAETFRNYLSALLSKCNYTAEMRENSTLIGSIRIYGSDGQKIFPIFASNYELAEMILELKEYESKGEIKKTVSFESADDVYNYLASQHSNYYLQNLKTGERKYIGKNAFLMLAPYLASFGGENYSERGFMNPSTGPYIISNSTEDTIKDGSVMYFRDGALSEEEIGNIYKNID